MIFYAAESARSSKILPYYPAIGTI